MLTIFNMSLHAIRGTLIRPILAFYSSTSVHNKGKKDSNVDSILKNYFNNRSEMSNVTMLEFFDRLKSMKLRSSFFNDHRWVHLNVMIEKNMSTFSTFEQFKLLHALTKMNHFNDLFNSLLMSLIGKLNDLSFNQKANLFYFIAKRGKPNPKMIKSLSDSLLETLANKIIRLTYSKSSKIKRRKKLKVQQQDQEQLFPQLNTQIPQNPFQVDCKSLIMCFWSLQKMHIKDPLLTQHILKKLIRPNIKQMPAALFPVLMSTLWLHGMCHKRVYNQITEELVTRQKQLINLELEKLKMLCCMLCKPQIQVKQNQQLSEHHEKYKSTRRQLVLWLMQTLIIRHESKKQQMFSTSAYQMLTNASEAKIFDMEIYQKFISIISEDLIKIQLKQVIYLLSIIRKVRLTNNNLKSKTTQRIEEPQFCQNQKEILSQHLLKNLFGLLQNLNEQHPARKELRKMVILNFLTVPINLKKKIIFEEKKFKKGLAISIKNTANQPRSNQN